MDRVSTEIPKELGLIKHNILLEKPDDHLPPAAQALRESVLTVLSKTVLKPDSLEENEMLRFIKDLEKYTMNRCYLNSVQTLLQIFKKHPQVFKSMLIVSAYIDNPDNGKPFVNDQTYHAYFLGQAKDDIWYAVSPANYLPVEPDKRTFTYYSSPDLGSVMKAIAKREGNVWPGASDIKKCINEYSGYPLQYATNELDILNVIYKKGGTSSCQVKGII